MPFGLYVARVSVRRSGFRRGVRLIKKCARAFLFVTIGIAFSACAHLASPVPSDRIWQSDPREPVWVRHPPGPSSSFFYLVREGVSAGGDLQAAKSAEKRVAVFLAERFRTFQVRLSAAERERLILGWMHGMKAKKGPLLVIDRWGYAKKTDPDNPFFLESHVWVLVKVPADLIPSLRKRYSVQDRTLLRRIDRTHVRLNAAIARKNGFSVLVFLAQNRAAFRRIHSFRSFSGGESRLMNDIYLGESDLRAQFLATVNVAPIPSVPIPIPIRTGPFRAFNLPLSATFSTGKGPVPLSHVRPVLEIRPRPDHDPFPPIPLYQRGQGGVRKIPIRWTAIVWTSDLERFQRELARRKLLYDCPETDRRGMTVCRIRQVPNFTSGSRIDMGLEAGSDESRPYTGSLNKILSRVRSRVAILQEDSRYLHRLRIRVQAQGIHMAASVKKTLERALVKKGYLLASADDPGGLDGLRTATLFVRLSSSSREHTLPGGTVVVEMRIRYKASVLGQEETLLWDSRGSVTDVGFDAEEAFREAADSLSGRISNALAPDLWPRPERPDLSRYRTLRYSILDGLALCSGEPS